MADLCQAALSTSNADTRRMSTHAPGRRRAENRITATTWGGLPANRHECGVSLVGRQASRGAPTLSVRCVPVPHERFGRPRVTHLVRERQVPVLDPFLEIGIAGHRVRAGHFGARPLTDVA